MRLTNNSTAGIIKYSKLLSITAAFVTCSSLHAHAATGDLNFIITGQAQEVYDDNILYDDDNKIEDFITELILGAGLDYQTPTQNLLLTGSIKEELFAQESSLNNNSQYLELEFEKELNYLSTLTIENDFEHSNTPDTFEDTLGRSIGRFEFFQNDFLIDYEREIDVKWNYGLSYQNEYYMTERDDTADSISHLIGSTLEFNSDSLNTYYLNYIFDFTNYTEGQNQDSDDVYVNKFALGWQRGLNKTSQMTMEVGASLIDPADSDSTEVKPYAFLEYMNNWNQNTEITLTLLKEHEPSRFQNDIFDLWRVSSRINHAFNERLNSILNLFYGQGEFTASEITDKLFGGRIELAYEVRESIKLLLAYLTEHNDSTQDNRDYEKNRVTLGVTFEF